MSTSSPTYLDIQAEIGITKHLGGFAATDELLAFCKVGTETREILYVGCGIGVGPAYIARKFGCRVVAADISEKMLAWTAQRARLHHRSCNWLHRFQTCIRDFLSNHIESVYFLWDAAIFPHEDTV